MRSHKPQDTGGNAYAKPIPDILSQIKDSYPELRPAERRVADVVLRRCLKRRDRQARRCQ